MKVLYDHQAFDMQHYGGVSNCFVQLISNFPQGVAYDISLLECDNFHLRDSGLIDVPPKSFPPEKFLLNRHFLGQGILYGWYSNIFPSKTSNGRNRLYSVEKLKQGDFDVFHPTFFDSYFLPYLNGKPFVLTVHDMIPELFPSSSNNIQVKVKPLLCQKAAHIVAVSERTKQDLMRLLHVPEDKISVIYHGAPNYNDCASLKPLLDGQYILYVGQRRDSYKNFLPMLKSLAPVLQHHQAIKIVCTGPDFTKAERLFLEKVGLCNKVCHLHVNDQELQNLYAHALCFIYPSAYEGFGIPILEAYRANCPVLLNEASCFPEIAQKAAVYFHLDDQSSDLDQVMEDFLRITDRERETLLEKQHERLSCFSWQKSAQKLTDLYHSLV